MGKINTSLASIFVFLGLSHFRVLRPTVAHFMAIDTWMFRMSQFAFEWRAMQKVCTSLQKFIWAKLRNANHYNAKTDRTIMACVWWHGEKPQNTSYNIAGLRRASLRRNFEALLLSYRPVNLGYDTAFDSSEKAPSSIWRMVVFVRALMSVSS